MLTHDFRTCLFAAAAARSPASLTSRALAAATARRIAYEVRTKPDRRLPPASQPNPPQAAETERLAAEASGAPASSPARRSMIATLEERAQCHRRVFDIKRDGHTHLHSVGVLRGRVHGEASLRAQPKNTCARKAFAFEQNDCGANI